jgi:hypothetical protein
MLGVNYHVGPGNIICQEITCVACEPSTPIGENNQNLNCTTSRIIFYYQFNARSINDQDTSRMF